MNPGGQRHINLSENCGMDVVLYSDKCEELAHALDVDNCQLVDSIATLQDQFTSLHLQLDGLMNNTADCQAQVHQARFTKYLMMCIQCFCFQCFDAVDWAAGRASGL